MSISNESSGKVPPSAKVNPVVVITGSTRGLGSALAGEFCRRGCRVTISGRSEEVVTQALSRLIKGTERDQASCVCDAADRLHGQTCDVRDAQQVQSLWDEAVKRWGQVDIWVNNAGIPQAYLPAWELDWEQVRRIVDTNLLGLIHGSRTAMRGMLIQGGGQIYNLEGWGSDGKQRNGLTLYGTTKRAVRYFTRALAAEADSGPILIGTLSPGMMTTEFLTAPMKEMDNAEQMRRIINILGDPPDTVARFLVRKILANRRNHAHFAWLTGAKVLVRFLTAPIRRRNLFAAIDRDEHR